LPLPLIRQPMHMLPKRVQRPPIRFCDPRARLPREGSASSLFISDPSLSFSSVCSSCLAREKSRARRSQQGSGQSEDPGPFAAATGG
jgi:hypothetical protein